MRDLFQDTATPPASRSALFDEFWALVPKKIGKKAAQDAWKKLKADERQEAADKAEAWFKWWRKENPQASWIHPSTYLNQRRWEDEFEAQGEHSEDAILKHYANEFNGNGKMWSKPSDEIIQKLIERKMVTPQRVMDRLGV